jgi:lipoic acid synthetase
MVSASPMTRSSYHAGEDFEKLRQATEDQVNKRSPNGSPAQDTPKAAE